MAHVSQHRTSYTKGTTLMASDLMLGATNTLLIPGQEIVRSLDDPSLASITDGKWKTNYHNAAALCNGITAWRLMRTTVKAALPFLSPEEQLFLMSGISPTIIAKSNQSDTNSDPY